ncbi:hypothetical protein HW561_05680 [Rhodobacteraceae bacterium B1Z28]|uniref:DUF4760 domain-containing protein n=1 Tax=Ruegeria haliotis TaxID=2747601 RepID=A0ABX2PMM5_9RHOB|nr:hypothetical protein [Ruegeria haliotis]NVO55278.1 hypothetical protein [Ruegeria haliotis]
MSLNFRAIIEIVERLVVITAAGIAVFPLYQWYNEKDDRRLERITTFISAGSECLNHTDWMENNILISLEAWDESITNTIYARLNVAKMCSELYGSLHAEFLGEYSDKHEYFEPIWSSATRRDIGVWIEAAAHTEKYTADDFFEWEQATRFSTENQ